MKRRSIYLIIIATVFMGSLNSCLKDNSQPDFTQNKPIIELPIGSSAGNGGGNSIAAAFTIDEVPSDYFIYVNYAAPEANDKDVVVTLSVDEAALDKFNQVNEKTYTLIPATSYTFSSNKVTIPAGQRKVKFPVKINTISLDPTKTYALPISITDGGGFTVSGNFGTLVSVISLKNKWDGVYTVTGTMLDQVNSALTGDYPRTFHLVTQGPNTVAIYDADNKSFAHGILNDGAKTVYGFFSPVFTIDNETNSVTSAVNYYGQPAENTRAARLDVTGENKFTMSADGKVPVTFKVKYIMIQNGADRTFFNETWTYKEARK